MQTLLISSTITFSLSYCLFIDVFVMKGGVIQSAVWAMLMNREYTKVLTSKRDNHTVLGQKGWKAEDKKCLHTSWCSHKVFTDLPR